MTSQITHTLKKPIMINGNDTVDLTFNEPDIGDVIDAEEQFETEMARMTFVMARMCGAENAEFRKVGTRDYNAILAKCGPLMGNE